MTDILIEPPSADEYPAYYHTYVSLVPEAGILGVLEQQIDEVHTALAEIPASHQGHRYAPGKWSIREVVGHVADGERVFGYRALRFARNDATALAGFDEDAYVAAADFDTVALSDLADGFEHARRANLLLYHQLPAEAWMRRGMANGNPMSVRAIAWIIAGHVSHHLRILRERYL